jgi:hypothetical protein
MALFVPAFGLCRPERRGYRGLYGVSETQAGAALNAALFAAFDRVFNQLSYELGVAAAGFIVGEDA